MEENRLKQVQSRLNEISEEMHKLKCELWNLIEDKSIPIDDRWQLFLNHDMGVHEDYIVHWETFGKYLSEGQRVDPHYQCNRDFEAKYLGYDWYDRHETVDVNSLYERLRDKLEDHERIIAERLRNDPDIDEDDLYDNTIFLHVDERGLNFGEHVLDEWREEVLSRGISSFDYDW